VNVFLTYGIMLDSLVVVYVQYMKMQTDLQKLLSQDMKCSCCKSATVLLE